MKKLFILIVIVGLFTSSVSAMEFSAPEAPSSAENFMPEASESFGKDLWYVIKTAIFSLQPSIAEAAGVSLSLVAVVLLTSILRGFSGVSGKTVELVSSVAVGLILIRPSNALIQLGVDTVLELSEYGKLLMPVLSAALAAQGGVSGSASLYAGTLVFNTLLTVGISKILIPFIYIYIALCIANSAVGEEVLKNLRDFAKWLMTWSLKIILYVFTGYMGITGVVSGTTDAAAMKATKLAVTGMVPVVGNIISDASESILVSAGIMKNAVGVYGFVAILAICIGPFMQIGFQYLLLKITAGVCNVFGSKKPVALIRDFSGVLGFLLAMTGAICLMLFISTVCFMKGVS